MFLTVAGMLGDQRQMRCPVRASSAVTVLGGSVRYMMPSTTSGVVSISAPPPTWYPHSTRSFGTVVRLIWSSGE